jgi:hypothetical protein
VCVVQAPARHRYVEAVGRVCVERLTAPAPTSCPVSAQTASKSVSASVPSATRVATRRSAACPRPGCAGRRRAWRVRDRRCDELSELAQLVLWSLREWARARSRWR